MSGGDNLHVPPVESGTLVFDASGGVTSLVGVGGTIGGTINGAPTVRTRHSGHVAAHQHGHTTHHHAPRHAAHQHSTLHLAGERQPW